jgi:putative heme transporter
VTYWALWVAVTPGLTWPQAMVVAQSGTAVTNTVPGGSGIGVGLTYAMLESWGFSRGRSTLAVLITGVWNNLIKLGLPVLALALLALQGDAGGSRVVGGTVAIGLLAAAIVLFAMVLRSDRVAFQVGELAGTAANWLRRLLRRHTVAGWGPATVKFRSRAKEVLRRRWPAITAAALVSHLSLYLVLLTALRHVGVADEAVGWVEVLFVFAFARLVTAVRFTPGGAGVVEALLIGGLAPPAASGPRSPRRCWCSGRSPGCCRFPSAWSPTSPGAAGRHSVDRRPSTLRRSCRLSQDLLPAEQASQAATTPVPWG